MMTTNWVGSVFTCCALAAFSTPAATLYVWTASPGPAPPYTNWATAAHSIQEAVDIALAGEEIVVSNGVYAAGGRALYGTMTNRVAVDKPIRLRSVNGPLVTVIQGAQAPGGGNGDGAIRCAFLTNGAALLGFTLTNGATRGYTASSIREKDGGGVWCESAGAVVSNCILAGNSACNDGGGACGGTLNDCRLMGNSAYNGGGVFYGTLTNCTLTSNVASHFGGGAYGGTLNNCRLTGNSASDGGGTHLATLNACVLTGNVSTEGGGANMGTLNNCLLSGNSAWNGGGAAYATLNNCTLAGNSATNVGGGALGSSLINCIVYYNAAPDDPNYSYEPYTGIKINYCCTTPLPVDGDGDFSDAPAFLDYLGGNLRLQSNSPCINTGANGYVTATTDLDGRPRIVGGTVDVGAYEFQPGISGLFIGWLEQYGLPTDGSADFTDPDHDGVDNWHEWLAGTNPTNGDFALRLTITAVSPLTVSFSSSAAYLYTLQRCANLAAYPPGPVWTPVPGQVDRPGNNSTLILTDTNPPSTAFYRVSARTP